MSLMRYSEVIGLPVIITGGGEKVGVVEDIFFSPCSRRIKGFLLERSAHGILKRAVMMRDVAGIGRDAVLIKSINSRMTVKKADDTGELEGRGEIKGLRIYSKDGEELGEVKDVLFDGETGLVEGVEVSDGLYQDIVQGRRILPLLGKVEFSEENILVDREAVEEMTKTGGGIKKKFLDE